MLFLLPSFSAGDRQSALIIFFWSAADGAFVGAGGAVGFGAAAGVVSFTSMAIVWELLAVSVMRT